MKRSQKTVSKDFTTLQMITLDWKLHGKQEKYKQCLLLKKKTFTFHVKYTMVYVTGED